MKALWSLLAVLLAGCQTSYKADYDYAMQQFGKARQEISHMDAKDRSVAYPHTAAYAHAMLRIDSSLAGLTWATSKEDSAAIGQMYYMLSGDAYHHKDTTQAVFHYIDALPWFQALGARSHAMYTRDLADTMGDAILASKSPHMARLCYQTYTRAKQLALASGDSALYHLADSSYKVVARRVLTMPDSVRIAFGPTPERPARVPWMLATLAAAFIAASVKG